MSESTSLTILDTFRENGKVMARCHCSCGAETTKQRAHVNSGHVSSCGCGRNRGRFAGGSKVPLVNRFDDLTDEATCYWAGFLFGDGSVDKKGKLQVCLTSNNEAPEHLRKLSRHLFGIDRVNMYERTSRCHLQATDADLARNLAAFGVVPNKTYDQTLVIPSGASARHVIRGYFDADGWFSEVHHKGYVRWILGLCSYRAENLEVVLSHLPVKAALRPKKRQKLYELTFGGRDDIAEVTGYMSPLRSENSYTYKWSKIWDFRKRFCP